MTKESLIEMGYVKIGEVDGLELYSNFKSKNNPSSNHGFIFQFNPDYKESVGAIFITKEILENLIKLIKQ